MAQLHVGDNVEFMRKHLKDNSQSLIVTSPPYNSGLRNYGGHSWSFPDVAHEVKRILKPGGVCVWVVGDKSKDFCEELEPQRQSIYWTDVVKMKLVDTMIYAKTSTPFPDSAKKRFSQMFEFILVLAKDGPPRFFNGPTKPNAQFGKVNHPCNRKGLDDEIVTSAKTFSIAKRGVMGNVLTHGQGFNKSARDKICFEHPAVAPFSLCYQMVAAYSPKPSQKREIEKFTLFEPFLGSGQVLLSGLGFGLLSKNMIGVDQNPTFVKLAQRRLSDPEILAKNMKGLERDLA